MRRRRLAVLARLDRWRLRFGGMLEHTTSDEPLGRRVSFYSLL